MTGRVTSSLRWLWLGTVLPLLIALLPSGAGAQILSPGKLSRAHAELGGIGSCTQCHRLREAGASAELCLACHQPLANRIEAGRGYHAALDSDCATCHKEHLGTGFALIRFDTTAFRHGSAGYTLEGAHREVDCRGCHTPRLISDAAVRDVAQAHLTLDKTFLGLPTTCAACHVDDDPHGDQFKGLACTTCHDAESWQGADGFDHAEARYRLTGRHAAVECSACHVSTGSGANKQVRYRPLRFDGCATCHQDPHERVMPGTCEGCHSTSGWLQIDRKSVEGRFDHGATEFELVGRHAQLTCASCHDARTAARLEGIRIRYASSGGLSAYPAPVTGSCRSCHVDGHAGAFAQARASLDCTSCHGEVEWLPAHYGPDRHDETAFRLTGAHATVPCAACHRTPSDSLVFRVAGAACTDCHTPDDPHDGQFTGRACNSCHNVETFRVATFDHGTTRYPLDGAHRNVLCASCHVAEPRSGGAAVVRYRPLGTLCTDCHGGGP